MNNNPNNQASNIPNIQPLSPKEVMDFKIQLLLNINSLLLILLQDNSISSNTSLYMTKLHGNIQYLVSLTNPNVQSKPLDLKPVILDPNSNNTTNSPNTQNLITGMNKLYLLLNKLIELYP